jgi:cytochrome P450
MPQPADSPAPTRESPGAALSRAVGDHSRPIFKLLRTVKPMLSTPAFGLVTRADDVREVLADDEHFGVPAYNERMTEMSGPFILGLGNTVLYRHDHQALRAAIRTEDLPEIAKHTLAAGRERVRNCAGTLDVVRDLTDPTIDAVMSAYFGTPGPGGDTQLRWARDIFDHVFLNVSGKQSVRERALAAAEEMRPHLDAQIAHRRARLEAGHAEPDDALTRLLRVSLDGQGLRDIAIRHNLIGLIAGWIPTVSKAFTCAVLEILGRPQVLAEVRAAARAGDHDALWRYLLEALRFRPQTWALLRTCVSDHTVAADTPRATTFHAGARVLIATQSAMFDSRRVKDPETFRVDRPLDDYLHFGYGLHTCFGQAINGVQLPALAAALFEGPPIKLTEPGAGIVYDRSYPASLMVEFAPRDAA